MSRTLRTLRRAAPCVAAAALAAALAPAAQAHTPHATLTASVTTAVAYAKGLQDTSTGGYAGSGLSNEWAFSGLAAAGTAAADVLPPSPNNTASKAARPVYRTTLSDPAWAATATLVTDYERATLNAYSAGIDPARVSVTRNLIAGIAGNWQPSTPGYWGTATNFNGTVFALLALSGATTTAGAQRVPQALLDKSISVVRRNQHADGGWNWPIAEGVHSQFTATSDIDMTGAALASLCQAGVAATDSAVVTGKNFLKGKLITANGAFNSSFGANTDSNGWAVSGLNACGFASQGSDFTSPTGKTPIDYLVTQQLPPGGGFRYTTGSTANAYASLDALRALAGGAFSATPPTPSTSGQPKFVGDTLLSSSTTSRLALVVDDNSGTLKVCSVPVAANTTTTLGTVLTTATASATPSGCVSGWSPASGTITTLNGVPNAGGTSWKSSRDGSAPIAAATGTAITLGDTISLKFG